MLNSYFSLGFLFFSLIVFLDNLFDSFDYSFSYFYDPWFFFSVFFLFYFLLSFYSYLSSFRLFSQISGFLWVLKGFKYLGLFIFVVFLFKFILFSNLLSLFPYVVGLSSQLWFCFYFSFLVVFLVFFLSLYFDIVGFVVHLVPLGCPLLLSPFLVVIELISFWVRLITLAVRLLINISAGHVFSHVISGSVYFSCMFFNFFVLCFYLFFEVFVSFIQASVFSMLTVVYFL